MLHIFFFLELFNSLTRNGLCEKHVVTIIASALRGVGIQQGQVRAVYPAAATLAAAGLVRPSTLSHAAATLHGYTP